MSSGYSGLYSLSCHDVQDTTDAYLVVRWIEPSLLPGICGSCLAVIQQCAGNTVYT